MLFLVARICIRTNVKYYENRPLVDPAETACDDPKTIPGVEIKRGQITQLHMRM